MDTLGKIFYVNLLGYSHWFMYISISQLKDYSISVDQARYYTAVVSKYLETDTIFKKLHKTNLNHNITFTK